MVWRASGVFGRQPTVDLAFLVARAKELTMQIQAAETHLASLRDSFRSVETIAEDAGLRADLVAALTPPAAPPPIPMTRIRALKAFKVTFTGGRHGPEEYSGGPGCINDIPTAMVSRLRDRVQVVPASTEVHSVPLQVWMSTTDD